jgi:hypothetical protein
VVEPLLQHYGVRTRWLDVVDNIWAALWFACHEFHEYASYAHYSRRASGTAHPRFAYIVIFDVGNAKRGPYPGMYVSDKARLVDLRYATPSVYLRPHAQHGCLLNAVTGTGATSYSLQHLELATVRVELGLALEWLGSGTLLSSYSMFPPATRDEGYRRLLEHAPALPSGLGRFLHYGPSS